MGSMTENPILNDEDQDKDYSHPTTPVSQRPNQPPMLMRSRPFETRSENVPNYIYGNLFENFIRLVFMYFDKNYI